MSAAPESEQKHTLSPYPDTSLRRNYKTYLFYIAAVVGFVVLFALFQHIFVIKVGFLHLHWRYLGIPALVGTVLGYLLAKIRLLQQHSNAQVSLLRQRDTQLHDLNDGLERTVLRRTEQLHANQRLTQSILDSQSSIVLLTNGRQITNANQQFFRFLNEFRDLDEFLRHHQCICEFFVSDHDNEFIGTFIEGELWVNHIAHHPNRTYKALIQRGPKNHVFDVKVNRHPLSQDALYVATFTDITELVEYKQSLEQATRDLHRQLFTDRLTGLFNRTRLLHDLECVETPGLLILNIDAFKEINDFFGHSNGDWVLQEAAARLSRLIKDQRALRLYRLSGDEYAILVHQTLSTALLEELAWHAYEAIEGRSFSHQDGSEISVGITCGIVECGAVPTPRLLVAADLALKVAKRHHKSYVFYRESFDVHVEYGKNIAQARILKNALQKSQLRPYYQPILNNHNLQVEKYECLARIVGDSGELILPKDFIGAAKASKLYPHVTRSMVEQACATFQHSAYEFSINISIQDILNGETVQHMLETINRCGTGERMVFEILESEGIENYSEINSFVAEAKKLGCKIAIDDFGSGYSNFNYLLRLQVDYLKIDASLIKHLDNDRNSQIIVRTIQDFAAELGIQTIAEYIHSQPVFEAGCRLGLDYSQGWYIGEPVDRPGRRAPPAGTTALG